MSPISTKRSWRGRRGRCSTAPGRGRSGIRLRRSGRFAQLPEQEQRVILAEHGAIGMSYGAGDYAHDIRLACHGLDKHDNDFVVGLIGKELVSAVARRADDAQDPADVAVSRTPGSLLRRPRRLAERIAQSWVEIEGSSLQRRPARPSASSDRPSARAASPRCGSTRS